VAVDVNVKCLSSYSVAQPNEFYINLLKLGWSWSTIVVVVPYLLSCKAIIIVLTTRMHDVPFKESLMLINNL